MEIQAKSLNDCNLAYLEKNFGLRRVRTDESLDAWLSLSATMEVDEAPRLVIPIFQDLLITNVESWNEQELSLHFIGPMFSLIRFTDPYRFNLFAEHFIKADVLNVHGNLVTFSGKPDEMIASGFREPEAPYFCFQEFKRESDPNGDPIGQALAAMLIGQVLNENRHPIYGCYMRGRDWYFMTLSDKQYCISRGFDATTEDVFVIFKILKALKGMISELVEMAQV